MLIVWFDDDVALLFVCIYYLVWSFKYDYIWCLGSVCLVRILDFVCYVTYLLACLLKFCLIVWLTVVWVLLDAAGYALVGLLVIACVFRVGFVFLFLFGCFNLVLLTLPCGFDYLVGDCLPVVAGY